MIGLRALTLLRADASLVAGEGLEELLPALDKADVQEGVEHAWNGNDGIEMHDKIPLWSPHLFLALAWWRVPRL